MSEESLELVVIGADSFDSDFMQKSYGQYPKEKRDELVSLMQKAKEQFKEFDFPFLAISAEGYRLIADINLNGITGTFGIYPKHSANCVKQYMGGYELNGRDFDPITAVVNFGPGIAGLYEALEEKGVKVKHHKLE
jgi:hypothetical protein